MGSPSPSALPPSLPQGTGLLWRPRQLQERLGEKYKDENLGAEECRSGEAG